MKKPLAVLAGLLCCGLAAVGANSETLEKAYPKAMAIVIAAADAPKTRTNSEFTKNEIPVQVGECSTPRVYKDAIERQRVAMDFKVTYCKEKVAFDERADGTEGWGIFKHTKWVRVPGTERTTYEYAIQTEDFDLSYDPDSYRTPKRILGDLQEACEASRDRLSLRMQNERKNVRCQ